jgi:gamma-glutamyltranspeptidase/glutathione hydrolase
MITAPHHLAAESGLSVLREGGNAVEAMVAAAATIAVVYPHMNSLGGDGFWLLSGPALEPIGIDACGAAARGADAAFYRQRGCDAIPTRGPLAANTVAGTLSGWQKALEIGAEWGGRMRLERLLEDAIHYAEKGVPVTVSQERTTAAKLGELEAVPGFAESFLVEGLPPKAGTQFENTRIAATLRQLARCGIDDFYRGELARSVAADLARVGSPLNGDDLSDHAARIVKPLAVEVSAGTLFNLPPPTQGLASLMILAIFDRLGVIVGEGFEHVHGLVEATKRAFLIRDSQVTDPAYMSIDPVDYLRAEFLDQEAGAIDSARALSWPREAAKGDTIWMGAIDGNGRAVSFIQSIYWEFGSGVVLSDSGIHWQNRGTSFALGAQAKDRLEPGRKPFHTLNPALARLADGRVMPYGTMGGEGQPQTQAAVFSRYAQFGVDLQQAITAPRWLLGRTWGEDSTNLKIESRFDADLVQRLRAAGHDVEVVEPFTEVMGHAGALVWHPDGLIQGASDPRSDGRVAAF